jgi:hypothetical protein
MLSTVTVFRIVSRDFSAAASSNGSSLRRPDKVAEAVDHIRLRGVPVIAEGVTGAIRHTRPDIAVCRER